MTRAHGQPRRSTASPVEVPEGATMLDACRKLGIDTPTLCYGETLTARQRLPRLRRRARGPRVLVPACSRKAEDGMVVHDRHRARAPSRKMVLEFWPRRSTSRPRRVRRDYLERYDADPARYGPPAPPDPERDRAPPRPPRRARRPDRRHRARSRSRSTTTSTCATTPSASSATSASTPAASSAQNTFAIAVAGRGFDARISTEYAVPLPDSACVYCGNCIAVCPTGALMFAHRARAARGRRSGTRTRQTQTDTICPYCGVGCNLDPARAGQPDRQGHARPTTTTSPAATSASRAASASSTCSRAPTTADRRGAPRAQPHPNASPTRP